MFKRLFSLICFLFICLVPVNLFALEDNYIIKSNGSVNSLYSKYIWDKSTWVISGTKTPSGYFCDGSTRQYWNYYKPPRSTGCDNKQKIGLEACGYWSSTKASNSNLQSNYTRLLCTQSGSRKVEEKNLIQNAYKTDNGSDAFCVNPGRAFSEQTYVKSEEYNVSDCKTSNNSYYCALASVFANYSSADYLAKLTALRLIAGAYNQGGGWWDSSEKSTYAADIYAKTAKKIMDGTVDDIESVATKTGILYDRDNTNGSFREGVEIFKSVMNGFEIWAPSAKVVSKSYDGSQVTLNIETNFDGISTISNVTYNGYNVNYSAAECSNSSSKTCMTVTFNLDSSQVTNCKNKIRIFYDKIDSKAISSVYLYTASQNVGNQQMVVYDTSGETYVDVSICPSDNPTPNGCRYENGKYYGKDGREVDEETYAKECATTCPNTKIEYNMPKDCEDDGTNGTISDPTMCTIMNSISSVKNSYKKDYGNEYCTVYCRESLKFTFMDKETAIAGRYFNHNVESYKTNKQYLSTVILSTRQCSSIIDYDKWKKAYKEANEKVLSTWNDYKKYEAQNNHLTGPITESKTCSACSSDSCCTTQHAYDSKVVFDPAKRQNKTITVDCTHCISGNGCAERTKSCTYYTWYKASYNKTNADDGSTVTINVSGDSKSDCSITCSCSCSGCNDSTSNGGNDNIPSNYSSHKSSYERALGNRQELINQINSCNFVEGSDAYNKVMDYNPKNTINIYYAENFEYKQGYDINIKNVSTSNEVVKRTYANSSDWSSFCGKDCNGNLSNLSSSSNNVTLTYWDCSGSETSAICSNKGINVPQNRLANIEVERETQHYQSNEFYVQAFTGEVDIEAGKTGYWFYLNDNYKHLYPVSSVRRSGNYGIKVTYSDLGDPKSTRKMANGNYTCSYDVVNELTIYDCDDNYDDHTCKCLDGTDCSKNVDGQVGMGVYYRPISLNDVFPHSSYSPTVGGTINVNTRNIGENWTTAKAVQVVKEIQSSGDNLIVDKKPQYVVKLTPSIMKKIRSYNDKTTYLDNSIYKCDNNSICYSSFLDKDLKNIMGSSNYRNLYSKDSSIKSDSLFYYNRDNYIKK